MSMSVELLVISWNHSDLTDQLVASIQDAYVGAGCPLGVRLHVLDNNSDAPYRVPANITLPTRLTRSPRNLGYSGGMRFLIDSSEADALWLLNNDCVLPLDAFVILLEELNTYGQDGGFLLFPKVVNPDGSTQSKDCRWNLFLGWRTHPYEERTPLFGDKFVAPILDRTLAQDLHLFPAKFHTYGEDFDACYAIVKSGVMPRRIMHLSIEHQLSSSRPSDPFMSYRFSLQGASNYLSSVRINYSKFSSVLCIPCLFLKIWFVDLLVKNSFFRWKKHYWREWASWPLSSARRHNEVAWLRRVRRENWSISDHDVSSL